MKQTATYRLERSMPFINKNSRKSYVVRDFPGTSGQNVTTHRQRIFTCDMAEIPWSICPCWTIYTDYIWLTRYSDSKCGLPVHKAVWRSAHGTRAESHHHQQDHAKSASDGQLCVPLQLYPARPVRRIQASKRAKRLVFLTQEELHKLEDFHFVQMRLETVKNIYLFSVYTGLAYHEAQALQPKHIAKDLTAGTG